MERLDKFLYDKYKIKRSLIQRVIKEGKVKVNQVIIRKPSLKVDEEDSIYFNPEDVQEYINTQNFIPTYVPLDIVYEDDNLLVINKQPGISVHPGAGNPNNTLVNGIAYYNPQIIHVGGENRVGLLHRLDKDTSGILLIAKNNETFSDLSLKFKDRAVTKEYVALLSGILDTDMHIDTFMGRNPKNRFKRAVLEEGKRAVSDISVVEHINNNTLVEMFPKTGRTHQLRVHAKYINHPIIGDSIYLSSKEKGPLFLHARRISFNLGGKDFTFSAEFPNYWKEILEYAKKKI